MFRIEFGENQWKRLNLNFFFHFSKNELYTFYYSDLIDKRNRSPNLTNINVNLPPHRWVVYDPVKIFRSNISESFFLFFDYYSKNKSIFNPKNNWSL